MENQLHELRALTAHAGNRRTETGIPRVAMVQGKVPEHELAAVYDPMVNLILQGRKSMTIGDRTLNYDPASYFVMSIDLPAVGSVHPSEEGAPYLAVSLTIDPHIVASVLASAPPAAAPAVQSGGFSVASVTPDLLDAWSRRICFWNWSGLIAVADLKWRWKAEALIATISASASTRIGL
jgi:hypothetical protein